MDGSINIFPLNWVIHKYHFRFKCQMVTTFIKRAIDEKTNKNAAQRKNIIISVHR